VTGGDTIRIMAALGRLTAPPSPRDRAPSPRELEGDTAKCMLCVKRLIMKDSRASARPVPRLWVGFGTPGRSPEDGLTAIRRLKSISKVSNIFC